MASSGADSDMLRVQTVNGVEFAFIDDTEALRAAMTKYTGPAVAVDLEGVDLGRDGAIATLQLCFQDRGIVYIVDITTLGDSAFARGEGLRELLEDPDKIKIFFDCRSDLNALFYQYDVEVPASSVVDLQLLDVGHGILQGRHMTRVGGLGYLLEKTSHAGMSYRERQQMQDVKMIAKEMFVPECGGSYIVWLERPLRPVLLEYATDNRYFHALQASFLRSSPKLDTPAGRVALAAAAKRRVARAHSDAHNKHDRATNVAIDQTFAAEVRALRYSASAGGGGYAGGGGGGYERGYSFGSRY